MCPFISKLEFQSEQNKHVDTFTLMPKEFEIGFELNSYGARTNDLIGIVDITQNIFHLTTGESCCNVGSMIPAVWIFNGNLNVGMAINGVGNLSRSFAINDTEWYNVLILQKKNKHGDFTFKVLINAEVKWSLVNINPKEFKDVKLFISNPWHQAFNGSLRNFHICFKGTQLNSLVFDS